MDRAVRELGALEVNIRIDTSCFWRELAKAREAFMDLFMRFFYCFEVAGQDDGTPWGEWDVFV